MKGTLKKSEGSHYDLYTDKGLYTSTYQWTKQGNLLSSKNCKAIENGYDLDELASKFAYNQSPEDSQESFAKFAFIEGFQKAMELMEGKKYNRQDVIHALTYGVMESKKNRTHSQILEEYRDTHLLQPKEWEVEIEQELIKSSIEGEALWRFKIDKDGCLILKEYKNEKDFD